VTARRGFELVTLSFPASSWLVVATFLFFSNQTYQSKSEHLSFQVSSYHLFSLQLALPELLLSLVA